MNAARANETPQRSDVRDPEAIARDIDAIRGEVHQTLDALQAKLSPGQMVDRTLHFVRENGGEFAGNLGATLKQNPLPVILTGVGLMWMIASRASPSNQSGPGRADQTDRSSVRERASEVASSARERLSDVKETLSDKAEALSEKKQELTQTAAAQAQRAREGLERLMEEQPLLVGALGVALGALVGAMLPESETENRTLGEARDRALQRTKAAGAQQSAKVREVAAGVVQGSDGSSCAPP